MGVYEILGGAMLELVDVCYEVEDNGKKKEILKNVNKSK